MKTKLVSLLVVILIFTTQCLAQKTITVEAKSNDISNNLDLQAVASIFGDSKDLEDFEMRLNDDDNQISNLDLNNDGEVDYLRVIESSENNVHVVVIQDVLAKDVYQDVATIVVDRNDNRRTHVQVIGDPYVYGDNYIIEPVYVYTPSIFSFFWGPAYVSWRSPYYWGYYPIRYHHRHPFGLDIYMNNISLHINHYHRYYYTDHRRNEYAVRLQGPISRNDYGTRFPERNFTNRNQNVRNKYDIQDQRNSSMPVLRTRSNYPGNESQRRSWGDVYTTGRPRNFSTDERNSTTRTYTPSGTPVRNEGNRGQAVERRTGSVPGNGNSVTIERNSNARSVQNQNNGSYQMPVRNETRETRTPAPVNNTRQAPVVSQPAARQASRQVERKQAERTNNSESNTRKRSSESGSQRR